MPLFTSRRLSNEGIAIGSGVQYVPLPNLDYVSR